MRELDSPHGAIDWLRSRVSGDLEVDSRRIGAGDGFIAWPGAAVDGRGFVRGALERQAAACLVEGEGVSHFGFSDEAIASLRGLKAATGLIASEWYGWPTDRIDLFAITGTNGKTSTAWWLAQALSMLAAGHQRRCAVIGTLGVRLPAIGGRSDAVALADTGLTTPDPVTLQRWLRRLADDGFDACALEASSIGLAEQRLDGCRIRVAIFTNLSQDHLDYHGSMEDYWLAKRRLFDWPGLRAAVLNIDDPRGVELAGALQDGTLDVWTVSRKGPARLRAHAVEQRADGVCFELTEASQTCRIEAALLGDYNVSNLLGVIAALRAAGVPLAQAAAACRSLTPVPGRMERVETSPGQPLVVVDYAHTPDALAQVLAALRPVAQERGGRLWCVFGCGGGRDRSKRAPMAAAVENGADGVVLTSDNPRGESPLSIIADAMTGLRQPERAVVEPDRARAIEGAIVGSRDADVICIAGKGHETTQEIDGCKLAFSDRAQAERALAQRVAQRGLASPTSARAAT